MEKKGGKRKRKKIESNRRKTILSKFKNVFLFKENSY